MEECYIETKARISEATIVLGMAVLVLLTGCALLNSQPVASFTCTPSCGKSPLVVSFDASASSDSDGSIVSYVWSFGDGGSWSGITATHTYNNIGAYNVQLTVTDDSGASRNGSQDVYVASEVAYDDVFRNNESYVGDVVYFRGKIIQVQEQLFGGYVWRVATEQNTYFGYTGDVLWVNYDGPRFLEGDIIDLCGKVKGLKTYTAILGQQVTIPEIDALSISLYSE